MELAGYEEVLNISVFIFPDKMDSVKDVLGKWGKKAAEATKKAEDLAGNMWQHCKFWIFGCLCWSCD